MNHTRPTIFIGLAARVRASVAVTTVAFVDQPIDLVSCKRGLN